MAFYMINIAVLRIPSIKYVVENYTCDSVHQTKEDVIKKLKKDKNVIDFYEVM